MSAPILAERPRSTSADSVRYAGLDWLRAGASLAVVALHAGIPYTVALLPGLIWSTQSAEGSPAVDALVWRLNGFVMPLFFVMSGFLASQFLATRGANAYVRQRTQRILGPLLFGIVVILPLDLYTWLLGWAGDGRVSLRKLRSLKVTGPEGEALWGLSHLWYLEYLWLFCVGGLAARQIFRWTCARRRLPAPHTAANARSCNRWRHWLSSAQPVSLVEIGAMVVAGAALWWEPRVLLGFRHSWWPLPANLVFFGAWFSLGWLTQLACRTAIPTEARFAESVWPRRTSATLAPHAAVLGCEIKLLASWPVFVVLLPLVHAHVRGDLAAEDRPLLIGLTVVHGWLAATGWFGVSLKWLTQTPPPAVRYLADASFWIYLFHHPVVGLTHISLSRTSLPLTARTAVAFAAGLTLSLLTYHVMVRRTWVGWLLNGRSRGHVDPPLAAGTIDPVVSPLRKSA
jgi:peptidoglycan/LPS O-acetylase OafA/YrhL